MARRLMLSHQGRVFLDRWGLECRWFGVFVHHIAGPDPGVDLHDHPWPFVSLVVRGSYLEEVADARNPRSTTLFGRGRWSVHRMPLTRAHRITLAKQGTWTLVLRGRKQRSWGFYQPEGFVDWRAYDYAARRPVDVESSHPEERLRVVR